VLGPALREEWGEILESPAFARAVRDAVALPEEAQLRLAQAGAATALQGLRSPDLPAGSERVGRGTQILLAQKYQELRRAGSPLPSLAEVGFRAFSQFDEDGILLFLFSIAGTTDRRAIEVCSGVGYECNSANLIVNHGWDALLIDGSAENQAAARAFFAARSETQISLPQLCCAWVEPETIDALIEAHGFTGDVDLLAIDLDGVDYWVWRAISCVRPRVVVVEYQPWFGADEPYTIRNLADYRYSEIQETRQGYVGCSLAAYVKLAREKGYRLVGCNRNQLNAFFLRDDVAPDLFPEVPAAACLDSRRVAEMRAWIRPLVEAQLARGEWERV
jgi:hypothetical protein